MARKNILEALLAPQAAPPAPSPATPPAPAAAAAPRAPGGAVGAVSRAVADLKSRSVLDLDPHLIDAGGVKDRLESDAAEDEALRRSIEAHGQQVPVLVRPHPTEPGRYQIVYGRRRVLALRDLGRPVKALLRDLDDRELVMAQGQENSARRDLSWIEKANFALQMQEAGYERAAICDALTVDKTVVSRMLSVIERIPIEVVQHIGAAPSVGRERWIAFADTLEEMTELWGGEAPHLTQMIDVLAPDGPSDERFTVLQDYLERRKAQMGAASAPPPSAGKVAPGPRSAPSRGSVQPIRAGGLRLGSARLTDRALVLRLDRRQADGFDAWLLDRLPEIHRDWLARTGGGASDDPATETGGR